MAAADTTTFGSFEAFDAPNGLELECRFTFKTLKTVNDNFDTLLINLYDATSAKNIASKTVTKDDIKKYINGLLITDLGSKFVTYLPYGTATAVKVTASENGSEDSADKPFEAVDLIIKRNPSPPTISLSKVTFSKNIDNVSVTMSSDGILRISPKQDELATVNKIVITATGKKVVGGVTTSFPMFVQSVTKSFTFSQTVTYYDYAISTTDFPNLALLKPDSDVTFSARCDANGKISKDSSNEVKATASIRLAAPVLISATSFENKQVTVSGTMKSALATGQQKYSILAQKIIENQELLPTLWKKTDVANVEVTVNSKGTVEQFSKNVTKVDSVVLELGEPYAFIAVLHNDDFVGGKSIAIDAVGLLSPPLDQSVASNQKKAVAIEHFDKTYKLTPSSPDAVLLGDAVTFTPGFLDSNGAAVSVISLPKDDLRYEWSFSKNGSFIASHKSKLDDGQSDDILPTFIDSSSKDSDEYTISVDILYTISSFVVSNAENPIPEYAITQNIFNVIKLASFTTKTKKPKPAGSGPGVENLNLELTKIGSVNRLATSYAIPSADKRGSLKLQSVSIQLMKGKAGTSDNGFKPLVLIPATTIPLALAVSTITVPKNGDDLQDAYVFQSFNLNSADKFFTVRVKCSYTDTDNNSQISSPWVYYFHELKTALIANAPTSVSLQTVASTIGKSFSVGFGVDTRSNITGLPSAWGSDSTVIDIDSATINLFNVDGRVVANYKYEFTSEEKGVFESSPVTVSNLNPKEFSELVLVAGEYIYAEVSINYKYKNDKYKNEISVGAKNNRNTIGSWVAVPPQIEILSVKLTQSPQPLQNISGNRQVDDKMVTLKISAEIDLKKLPENTAQVTAYMSANNAAGNQKSYSHPLVYNSSSKLWESAAIYPDKTLNYKKDDVGVVVVAFHPGSSNPFVYKVLQ
jgi:hypothetical protein